MFSKLFAKFHSHAIPVEETDQTVHVIHKISKKDDEVFILRGTLDNLRKGFWHVLGDGYDQNKAVDVHPTSVENLVKSVNLASFTTNHPYRYELVSE